MSVFNAEDYLGEAVKSVINQSFRNFEFLIIDDFSTDGSYEILSSYNDDRVRIIRNRENIGLTKSLNIGLQLARGKFIARIDADDVCEPTRLEKQLNYFLDSDIVLVASEVNYIDEHSKFLGYESKPNSYLVYSMLLRNWIVHSSVMFDKHVVLSVGGYNENLPYSQDYDLWSRLLFGYGCRVIKIDERLVNYRFLKTSISKRNSAVQDDIARNVSRHNVNILFGFTALSKMNIKVIKSMIKPEPFIVSNFTFVNILYSYLILCIIPFVLLKKRNVFTVDKTKLFEASRRDILTGRDFARRNVSNPITLTLVEMMFKIFYKLCLAGSGKDE